MTEIEKKSKKPKGKDLRYKDWEKDRRNRTNKAFDVLASLLPKYDPSKPFSKLEILQRSVILIEQLQTEKKELLSGQNIELLKHQEDLEASIKVLKARNDQLAEVLRKAEIPIPEFNAKNTWIRNLSLDSKVEKISSAVKIKENNVNEANLGNTEEKIDFKKEKKYSKKLTDKQIVNLEKSDKSKTVKKKVTEKNKSTKSNKQKTKVEINKEEDKNRTVENTKETPPLLCLQRISNALIPPETKIPPSTTMVISSVIATNTTSTDAISTSAVTNITLTTSSHSDTTFSTLTTPIMAPKEATEKNSNRKRAIIDGGETNNPVKIQKIVENPSEKSTNFSLTINTNELSSDIFSTIDVPQSGSSNPESLSPTATYLLNFPIVSTKMTEDEDILTGETNTTTNRPKEGDSITSNTEKVINSTINTNHNDVLLEGNFTTFLSLGGLEKEAGESKTANDGKEDMKKGNLLSFPFDIGTSCSYIPPVIHPATTTTSIPFYAKSSCDNLHQTSSFSFSLTSTTTTPSTNTSYSVVPPPTPYIPAIQATNHTSATQSTTTPSFSFTLTNTTNSSSSSIPPPSSSSSNFFYNKSPPKSQTFPNFSFPPAPAPPSSHVSCMVSSSSCQSDIPNFSFSLTSTTTGTYHPPSKNTGPITTAVVSSYNTFNPFATIDQNPYTSSVSYETPTSSSVGNNFMQTISDDYSTPKKLDLPKKTTKQSQKYHQVNWMAVPQFKNQPSNDFPSILPAPLDFMPATVPPPPPPTSVSTSQTTYYPPPIPSIDINRKSDIFFAHPPGDDNFTWSPNKMSNLLDNTSHLNHFMPATLPSLHGDLALSIPQHEHTTPKAIVASGSQTNTNFFSVSNLVDNTQSSQSDSGNTTSHYNHHQISHKSSKSHHQNHHQQTPVKHTPSKTGSSRSKYEEATPQKSQRQKTIPSWNYGNATTDPMSSYNESPILPPPIMAAPPSLRPPLLPTTVQKPTHCNSYSAESLIGNTPSSSTTLKREHQQKYTSRTSINYNENLNNFGMTSTTSNDHIPYYSMDGSIVDPSTNNYTSVFYNNPPPPLPTTSTNYMPSQNSGTGVDSNYYGLDYNKYQNISNISYSKTKSYHQTSPVKRHHHHHHGHGSSVVPPPPPPSFPTYDSGPLPPPPPSSSSSTNTTPSYFHQVPMGIGSPMMSSTSVVGAVGNDDGFHHLYPSMMASATNTSTVVTSSALATSIGASSYYQNQSQNSLLLNNNSHHQHNHHHHHQNAIPSQLPTNSSNSSTVGAASGSGTSLANFNLSTICPEINNEKDRWG